MAQVGVEVSLARGAPSFPRQSGPPGLAASVGMKTKPCASTTLGVHFSASRINEVNRRLFRYLHEGGLIISNDKNKIVTNSPELNRNLEKLMADIAPSKETKEKLTHTQVVKLGVDYAAGQPVKYTKAAERL